MPSPGEVQVEEASAGMNRYCVICNYARITVGLCTEVRVMNGLCTEYTVYERIMTGSNFMYGLCPDFARTNTVFRNSRQRKPPTRICARENT